ncbi:MAG: hypothetical protein CMP11_08160 [Zetaproteobacteria bacterium]|nr:hypothetical protein [Pseudobdellovibrionaceae bacterium]|tara:strand:- start:130 stop:537 length:408 start_codon:yes stop_codon:yes gene_type:complete
MTSLVSFHIYTAFTSHISALFAMILSFFFLSQHYLLKNKKSIILENSFPSLEVLRKSLFFSLFFGFILLSLSLISGFFFVYQDSSLFEKVPGKIIWAIFLWLWYIAALLLYKWLYTSRKILSVMTFVGFFLFLLA